MKKFKILLSLITITILLTSCGESSTLQDLWSEEYGDDWATNYFSTNTE